MKRRTMLAAVASATAGLAGCLSRGGSDGDDGAGDGNGTDGESTADGGDSAGRGSNDGGDPAGGSGDDSSGSNGESTSTDDSCDDDGACGRTEITDRGLETTARDCGSQDTNDASMRVEGDAIVVEGTLSASTKCHDAVLTRAGVEDGVLQLRIGVSEHDGVCALCIGEISYRARVTVDATSDLESVRVVHATGGEHSFDVE